MDDKQPNAQEALPPVFNPKQLEDDNPMPEVSDQEPLRQYSNEARAYHARYAELSEAHDNGAYNACREGCLDLLTEPNVPHYTRIQVLQMLSTILAPPAADSCLQEAATILAKMDNTKFQVQLLARDNEMMQADLAESNKKELNSDIEAGQRSNAPVGHWDFADGGSAGEVYYEFDRVLQEQRELGLAARKEAEASGFGTVFGKVDVDAERKFEQQIAAQGVKIRQGIERQEMLQAQEEKTARAEARTPLVSMFSRLSPGERMFGARNENPGGHMLHSVGDDEETASRGIEAVLTDAAIKKARAHTDAGREELAVAEAQLTEVAAQLAALKTYDAPDPATSSTAPTGDALPSIKNPKTRHDPKPLESGKAIITGGASTNDEGEADGGKAEDGVGAKKRFRETSRALLGAFGLKGKGKGDSKKEG
ncbi:uncharacterized protein RCC_08984 [Ramularia collo-cygni]|uniref:Uncharacterized protein n=1 Tax=Ramularia collo-cygni TaxID=112498 RepID=A0A2D3V5K7_9PEZI|nr:uncharacterized protein RCC_08984 [Ramularia collo-cygni]CZT23273.1 uncharacterized protein RCC_08984 [Ramularia collo-cygni]